MDSIPKASKGSVSRRRVSSKGSDHTAGPSAVLQWGSNTISIIGRCYGQNGRKDTAYSRYGENYLCIIWLHQRAVEQ